MCDTQSPFSHHICKLNLNFWLFLPNVPNVMRKNRVCVDSFLFTFAKIDV